MLEIIVREGKIPPVGQLRVVHVRRSFQTVHSATFGRFKNPNYSAGA
jgi:hypothetical protein